LKLNEVFTIVCSRDGKRCGVNGVETEIGIVGMGEKGKYCRDG